eukprot:gnl/TRDRNA2_/TRDRNA2_184109_c0_seq1.p1 gnl/TRDRNA2_/TRDRNA2_184109_c0~~gnl/TRDRNA2_/TRDRNA2_184109_c0_seq1.p1  ORF type:complete len:202 (+),score=56.01 gnl/TRDRNA2_/TRDRNA2_184109_c0_seq1:81-686(+)
MATPAEDNKKKGSKGYTYWKRPVDEGAAAIMPDNKPTRIDGDVKVEEAQSSQKSRWNSAGTWEEKDISKAARPELEQVLTAEDFVLFEEGTATKVRVSSATVTGEAQIFVVRGTPRVGFEFQLTVHWEGTYDGEDVSGELRIEELDSSDLDGLEIRTCKPKGSPPSAKATAAANALKKGARPGFRRAVERLQKIILGDSKS